ncbi:metallopeptidase MepB [Cadophora sp. MPI-SDFR-AT-0126]|nr:metallopeptidase MepB [Leotiomycetes sp. MPI-SDFR-AT-0126]
MASSTHQIPPQRPFQFTATPESIIDDAKRIIETSRKAQEDIVKSVRPESADFANVLLPLIQSENAFKLESHILQFYQHVSLDKVLRDASAEAEKIINEYEIETAMREDLYHLVDAVATRNEELDIESTLLLGKMHRDCVRNGLKLPIGAKRNRFKEIQQQLGQLSIKFRKNLNEAKLEMWFSPHELEGIPVDITSGLEKGTGEQEGKLLMTSEFPHYLPAIKYAKNVETRKRFLLAYENKCVSNVPILKEMVLLRDEAARLLEYPNHAAFRLEEKMAKKPETVNEFLADLQSRLIAGGRKDLEALKSMKKSDIESRGETFDGHYFLWDNQFYVQMLLEKEYSVDQQKIAEYFPLQSTIEGMLQIFEHLFGLVFVELSGDEKSKAVKSGDGKGLVWHEDVQLFCAWDSEDEGGGFLGYLYLDLYSRENKYSNPSNWNLQPGFLHKDGTRHYPSTVLVCAFSKPAAKKPTLLQHGEVVTLFHELGHGIHDLVAKTQYARFHGTMTVIDFGEAPSQMLENWCWTPTTLKSLSRHYSTLSAECLKLWEEQANGAPPPARTIPDEMIESLIRAKNVSGTLFQLRVLHPSVLDMMIHQPESHEALERMNFSEKYNRIRKELTGIEGPEVLGKGWEWGHGDGNMGHLVGDYDAGLYGYLYSKVFADDMFQSVFAKDPMNVKEGRRYRHAILEKGGSQDEMKTLTDFLGRRPKSNAFFKGLGIA